MELSQIKVQRYLEPGEQLLWAGRPAHRALLPDGAWVQFVITAAVTAAVFVLLPLAFFRPKLSDPVLGPLLLLFVILLGLLGAYIVFGKMMSRYVQRRLTFYGVTGGRLIAVTRQVWGGKLKSMDIGLIRTSSKALSADGTGTLKFGTTPSPFMLHADAGSPTSESIFGQYVLTFFDIPDAAKVHELVEIIRKESMTAGEPPAE